MKVSKFLAALLLTIFFTVGNCFAMNFSQPVYIGGLEFTNASMSIFDKDISTNGKISGVFKGKNVYQNAIAQFATGADALYVHCNYRNHEATYFGDKDQSNTVAVKLSANGASIFQIKNDGRIKLYVLQCENKISEEYIMPSALSSDAARKFVCIGKKADGSFVEYFNTDELRNKYFGNINNDIPYVKKVHCSGDTIVIECAQNTGARSEFRFKWNDVQQWFSVDYVE